MLVSTRKNYPFALARGSWKNRGPLFSEKGIFLRSVSEDLRSVVLIIKQTPKLEFKCFFLIFQNNVLHFLTDGSVKLMFSHEKSLCFAPLVLIMRALDPDLTDKDFAEKLIGNEESLYYKGCVLNMLRQMHDDGVHTMVEARKMLGASFRSKFRRLPAWYTDEEIAMFLLR